LLDAVDRGEPQAAEELLPLVYEELRRLAADKMAREKPDQTLQPTALVHEAWLRLLGPEGQSQSWNSRGHFFAAAAEAMRRILVDRARRRSRVRHGNGLTRVELRTVDLAAQTPDDTLLQVDEALEKLREEDPIKAQLVKLRYFAGMSIPEACLALDLSTTTGKRYWAYARAWLYEELAGDA
jgi:RNA polymerase sigma factor (TIGR02999 family)